MEFLKEYEKLSSYSNLIVQSRKQNEFIVSILSKVVPNDIKLKILDAAGGCGNELLFENFKNVDFYLNDGSPKMLSLCIFQEKYREVFNYEWLEFDEIIRRNLKFDLVYFLGNSISHVKNINEFETIINKVLSLLTLHGRIIFDIRKWEFDKESKRIVQPLRKINEPRLLHEIENGITLWDNCFYDDDRQYIEYSVRNKNQLIDNFTLSFLIIEKKQIEDIARKLNFKLQEIEMTNYPYRVLMYERK